MEQDINNFQKERLHEEINRLFPDRSPQTEFYLDNEATKELFQFKGRESNYIARQRYDEIRDREIELENKLYKETIKEVYHK